MTSLQCASTTRCRRLLTLILSGLCVTATAASATEFRVNTASSDLPDSAPGDGICATAERLCTLRAAVMEASASPGDDHVIEIPAGVYSLTGYRDEDAGRTGDLDLYLRPGSPSRRVTIRGAAPPSQYCAGACVAADPRVHTIIEGPAGGDRVFDIGPFLVVVMENLGITGGNLTVPSALPNCSQTSTAGAPFDWSCHSGGGIRSRGDLTLTNMAIYDNAARIGGGIHSLLASLTLQSVAVIANRMNSFATLRNGIVDWQPWYCGGGILNRWGPLLVHHSVIDGNVSNSGGGGICTFAGTEIRNSTISRNLSSVQAATRSPDGDGGGIQMRQDLRVLALARFLIVDSDVTGNLVNEGNGGGISIRGAAELHNVRVERNRAMGPSNRYSPNGHGGGIAVGEDHRSVDGGSSLNLRASNLTVADNRSDGQGAGIFLGPWGGLGRTQIVGATISNNRAGRPGGGVYAFHHQVELTNVTISGNSTIPQFEPITFNTGAGLYVEQAWTMLAHTTIAFNTANTAYGGGLHARDSWLDLRGNFFYRNGSHAGCFIDSSTVVALSGNLADDGGCPSILPSEVVARSGNLDPTLRDNGGPTKTHALLEGSVAMDVVPGTCTDMFDAPLTTDQRGMPRPSGAACDAGAYEFFRVNLIWSGRPFGAFVQSFFLMLDDTRRMLTEMIREGNPNVGQAENLIGELELASQKLEMLAAASDPRRAIGVAGDLATHVSRAEQIRLAFDRQSLAGHAARWKSVGALGARTREQLAALVATVQQ